MEKNPTSSLKIGVNRKEKRKKKKIRKRKRKRVWKRERETEWEKEEEKKRKRRKNRKQRKRKKNIKIRNIIRKRKVKRSNRGAVKGLNRPKLYVLKYKNNLESVDKSQNIVEQVNSNPNNISPTMSRRHIIWKSSIFAEMNQKFFTPKINTNLCRMTNKKFDDYEEL